MGSEKKCESCGATFEGAPRAKYCPACADKRAGQTRKEYSRKMYHQNNPNARTIGAEYICKKCGKPFIMQFPTQKFCPDCKTPKNKNETQNQPQRTCKICGALLRGRFKYCFQCNPNKSRTFTREMYERGGQIPENISTDNPNESANKITKICEDCGKTFEFIPSQNSAPKRRYCFDCAVNHSKEKAHERYDKKRQSRIGGPRNCKSCGCTFIVEEPNQQTCRQCVEARKRKAAARYEARVCIGCGAPLNAEILKTRKGPPRRYCFACQRERSKARARARGVRQGATSIGSEIMCKNCGRLFVKDAPQQKYCKECAAERKQFGKFVKKSGPLPDEVRYRLIGAPYTPPDVQPDDMLIDEERGVVEVGGYTSSPIPWPRVKKTGHHSPILCGDLVRAVRTESALAIKYWWGVSDKVVSRWRKFLGITQAGTEGTNRLYQQYKPRKLTDEVVQKGREQARSPESRAKQAATKKGRPAHPNTRAALLKAAQQPKSEAWKQQHSIGMRLQWQLGRRGPMAWTEEEKIKIKNSIIQLWKEGRYDSLIVWTPEKEAQLVSLLEKGLTHREAGEIMGRTKDAISTHLREMKKRG